MIPSAIAAFDLDNLAELVIIIVALLGSAVSAVVKKIRDSKESSGRPPSRPADEPVPASPGERDMSERGEPPPPPPVKTYQPPPRMDAPPRPRPARDRHHDPGPEARPVVVRRPTAQRAERQKQPLITSAPKATSASAQLVIPAIAVLASPESAKTPSTKTSEAPAVGDRPADVRAVFARIDRGSLRRAIVLNEVLSPPMALRDPAERI
jgi:hypothetical protein